MSFTRRRIDVTVNLGTGTFGLTGKRTVKLSGLRIAAVISKAGVPSFNTAQVRIYGAPLSLMNDIATPWEPMPVYRDNTILIEAGDDVSGVSQVFEGGIATAWVDLSAQPDGCIDLMCRTALLGSMQPVPPSSFSGATDVALILSVLAKQMGLQFENNGVAGKMLANPYLPGTAMSQALAAADAAGIEMAIDDRTILIWPRDGARGGPEAIISPETGLVGYPAYNGSGIMLRTLFNPALRFGAPFHVRSRIPSARGRWYAWSLTHNLRSETPGGAWFSEVQGKAAGL